MKRPKTQKANTPASTASRFAATTGIIQGRTVAASLLLVAAAVAVYLPTISAGFIWDDDDYVQNNRLLRSAEGLRRIWFEIGATPQYYPLVHTSYWIEYRLWGLSPSGYHMVNILLHALGAVLLWRVLKALEVPGAWVAAAIFALHPVEVESVAWITERKNVLSGVFYFAAALAYLRFAGLAQRRPAGSRVKWYALSVLLFLCALLSKTVTCTLPAALLLVSWWKRGRFIWRDVAAVIPLLPLGVAFGLLTAWLEEGRVGAAGGEWSLPFLDRCLIAGRVVWFYAGKLVVPLRLAFIYPRWRIDHTIWQQYLFPLAAASALLALWLGRRRLGRGPLTATLFFGGTLLPALGFFNVYPMRYSFVADHFQYLAGVGLIALGVAGAHRLLSWLGASKPVFKHMTAVVVLAVFGILALRQNRVYANVETLWSDTLQKNPEAWMAHNNLGNLLRDKGRIEEAMDHLHEAVRLNPNDAFCRNNLGGILAAKGRLDEAIAQCREALRLRPDYPEAHGNLAQALIARGRIDEAIDQYRQSLRLQPDNAQFLNNLGWLLATSERVEIRQEQEAVQLAERAAQLTDYRNAGILDTLAAAYAAAGHFDRAAASAQRAYALASAARATTQAAAIGDRLELYKQNKPYCEPVPASRPSSR